MHRARRIRVTSSCRCGYSWLTVDRRVLPRRFAAPAAPVLGGSRERSCPPFRKPFGKHQGLGRADSREPVLAGPSPMMTPPPDPRPQRMWATAAPRVTSRVLRWRRPGHTSRAGVDKFGERVHPGETLALNASGRCRTRACWESFVRRRGRPWLAPVRPTEGTAPDQPGSLQGSRREAPLPYGSLHAVPRETSWRPGGRFRSEAE